MKFSLGIAASLVVAGALAQGCASESPVSDMPSLDDDDIATAASITNGGYTATANTPVVNRYGQARGTATFSGPSPRGMGNCLLRKYKSSPTASGVVCSTVADCNNAPTSLNSAGYRYCAAPNGTGTKYCFYRDGSQAALCAGTPALPWKNNYGVGTTTCAPFSSPDCKPQPVAPGTYTTPYTAQHFSETAQAEFVSYACFEGCFTSDPSVSSLEKVDLGYEAWCESHPTDPNCPAP